MVVCLRDHCGEDEATPASSANRMTRGDVLACGEPGAPTDIEPDERHRKKVGGKSPDASRDLFADGKPVDHSYHSRPITDGDEAAKTLGEVSGYKPETI